MATLQQFPAHHPAAGDQVPLVTSRTHPAPLMGPADPGTPIPLMGPAAIGTAIPLMGPANPGTTAPLMGPAAIGTAIPLMGLADPGFTHLMDSYTAQRSFSHRKETP